MKNIYLTIALALVFSGFANAATKLRMFSNQDALMHVLHSKELAALQAPKGDLEGLDLHGAEITQSGGPGIGTEYKIAFDYHHLGGMLTVCNFTATVESIAGPKNPHNISTSELSKPTMSKVNCAY